MSSKVSANTRKRTGSMLQLDIYRLFKTPLLYLLAAFAAVLPGSFWAMLGMPKDFDTWQYSTGIYSGIVFALLGIFLAFFIGNDFKSGFIKNIFCQTSQKRKYTLSKLITGAVGSMVIYAGNLLGAVTFGVFAKGNMVTGLDDLIGGILTVFGMSFMFGGIFCCVDMFFKNRAWCGLFGSLMIGMIFMPALMIPFGSPLVFGGLALVAGFISLCVFPSVAALVMDKSDLI